MEPYVIASSAFAIGMLGLSLWLYRIGNKILRMQQSDQVKVDDLLSDKGSDAFGGAIGHEAESGSGNTTRIHSQKSPFRAARTGLAPSSRLLAAIGKEVSRNN